MFDIPMFPGWHIIFIKTIDMAQPRDKIAFCQHREHPDPYIHVNPIVELGQTALDIAMSG